MTDVANSIANKIVEDKLSALNKTLDQRFLQLENQKLGSRMDVLEQSLNSWPTTLGEQLTNSLAPLKEEVTATRTAIERLNIQPGSAPQGLIPRLKETFKGDKYLMTYQSLTSLGLLIRSSAGQNCKTTAVDSASCCSSTSPVATCPDELIFSSLASMIGEPPLDEGAFWTKLKKNWQPKWDAEMKRAAQENKPTTKQNIDGWKVLILRQTRVAY
jgi:hypothetical protein